MRAAAPPRRPRPGHRPVSCGRRDSGGPSPRARVAARTTRHSPHASISRVSGTAVIGAQSALALRWHGQPAVKIGGRIDEGRGAFAGPSNPYKRRAGPRRQLSIGTRLGWQGRVRPVSDFASDLGPPTTARFQQWCRRRVCNPCGASMSVTSVPRPRVPWQREFSRSAVGRGARFLGQRRTGRAPASSRTCGSSNSATRRAPVSVKCTGSKKQLRPFGSIVARSMHA